jgi:uncharacterized protein
LRILPLALLLAWAAAAADYPASAGYVNDFTGTLPDAVQQALELRVRAFERATSNEVAVAIMPSLQGQSLDEFAHGLFHSWNVGKVGLNNGVLFLWVPSEHKSRIEVGSGLANALTDQDCAKILDQADGLFRQEEYSAGVRAAVDGIIQHLGEVPPKTLPPAGGSQPEHSNLPGVLVIAGIALLGIALGMMLYHVARTHQLQQEVPATIARAAQLLQESSTASLQAAADLDSLRDEAPPEVWDGLAASLAVSPEHLQALRQKLDRIQAQRREEYREWNVAYHDLCLWTRLFEKQTALFTNIGTTLTQFRQAHDAALERIAQLPPLLSEMETRMAAADAGERNQKLLTAAQETFAKAGELGQHPPVNWLLVCDLLDDTQECLQRLGVLLDPDADAKTKRAAILANRSPRYWTAGNPSSAAGEELAALAAVWNTHNMMYYPPSTGGDASSSAGAGS